MTLNKAKTWRRWTGPERRLLADAIRANRRAGLFDRQRRDYSRRLASLAVTLGRSYQAVRHESMKLQRRSYV